MENLETKTIREIAIEAPLTIGVFEEHKIDFCCGGGLSFNEACQNAGADPAAVLSELKEVIAKPSTPENDAIETARLAELIDHIVCTHHDFTRSEFKRLSPLAEKVAIKHGENHPELAQIRDIVHTLGNEMFTHMQKEEMMLFPYIEKLERAAEANNIPPMPAFGSVSNPIRTMMMEHDQANEMLHKLREMSKDYTLPEEACPSYQGLYAGLDNIEKDFHRHVHLENNILFPRAVELEDSFYPEDAQAA
ncbi:MAG: iron-sulfur cluster repair di-iron protein [Acidobacteria bacterium]|nr:iron-sulfur cluster repair di-iron protein [Acidobacteriota bacterium]